MVDNPFNCFCDELLTSLSGSGKATVLAPSDGFVDEQLQTIFLAATSGGNTGTDPTPITSPPSTESSGSRSNTPIGATVGGAIGGVVVLAAIIGMIFFWRRKKRREADIHPSELSMAYPGNGQEEQEGLTMFMAPETQKYEMSAIHGPVEMDAGPTQQLTSTQGLVVQR